MADNNFNAPLVEEVAAAAAISVSLLLSPLLRPWYARWGATDAEFARTLPGDELIPKPAICSTRAITIRAPAARVWPWIVQMGQGRGGLYSYERLENAVGSQMHNADRIVPELQSLKAGEGIHLDPRQAPLPVHALEPGKSLLFYAGDGNKTGPADPNAKMPNGYYRMTWLFHLEPIDEHSTRLIIRSRTDYHPKAASVLMWRLVTDPMSFWMERQTLFGVKRRAECLAG